MTEIASMSDRYEIELEAEGTAFPHILSVSALGIMLLIAQYQGKPDVYKYERTADYIHNADMPIVQQATPESFSAFDVGVTSEQIMAEIDHVYAQLLSQQVELDESALEILYSNLWDLYE